MGQAAITLPPPTLPDGTPYYQSPAGEAPAGTTPNSFTQVYPNDPAGVWSGTNLGTGFALGYGSNLLSRVMSYWTKSKMPASGRVYFVLHDGHSGAPQTSGLPPGMALYRFRYDPKTGGPILAILSPQGFKASAPVIKTGTAALGQPVWTQYAWMIVNAAPTAPPAVIPPGVTSSGTWVWDPQMGGRWVWYPQDGTLASINGYFVYGDSRAFTAPNIWQAIPMPTISPDGTAGTWTQVHAGYWVWTPGAASSSLIWWLLGGVVVIGGIAYFALD